MIAGYVRLSRDDDGRSYSSIENQKLVILQYARTQNMTVERWYEDDGISGYRFDRPQFQQMMAALGEDGPGRIDTILVKDFSRLGRHNAKVLLLLDEFRKKGCRFVAVDDNYDSLNPDDDIIGIKTWYNERYVKDTSKKIRRVLNARQKEGTLVTQVPFGYRRSGKDRQIIEIVPEEAAIVTMIYDLYQNGLGYRRLAEHLNDSGVPTPSLMRFGQDCSGGSPSRRRVALEWSDSMVKEILDNDFYTGVYRLHKRARRLIHGTDTRVPKEEQYLFPDHHPAILSAELFARVQQIKKERLQHRTPNSFARDPDSPPSPFSRLLICKDCGCPLVPIKRRNKNSIRRYFICSTYNRKGKRFCPSAHLIEEWVLWEAVWSYIRLCRSLFSNVLSSFDSRDLLSFKSQGRPYQADISVLRPTSTSLPETSLQTARSQLQTLLKQKIRDLACHPDRSDMICAAYDSLESQLLTRIHELESDLRPSSSSGSGSAWQQASVPSSDSLSLSAAQILDAIIRRGVLTREDLDLLVDSIAVDADGTAQINLRGFISPALLPLHNAPAGRRNAGDGV